MTIAEKVGQVVMAGYDLYNYPDKSERGLPQLKDIERLITEFKIGHIILYSPDAYPPDVKDVADLTNHLQKLSLQTSGIPLFIAIDQEGGRVTRLTQGITPLPGNMALGATRSKEYAYSAGLITARELRGIGINMNLAPVLDVNNNPDNPVINIRSFGEDPRLVADLGQAFIRGSLDGQIIPVAKHFPGHGDTRIDSHYDLPTVRYNTERLHNIELLPFKRAIETNVPVIMPAHITFPGLDPTPGLPATLSEKIISGLLKKDLGFKGLVLCDDLEMSAITNSYGSCAQAAVKSLSAGTDIVMIAHTYKQQLSVCQELKRTIENKIIPLARLDEAVTAVLVLKKRLYDSFSLEKVLVDPARIKVNKEKNKALALNIAQSAATLVQDDNSLLPLRIAPNRSVLYLNPITGPNMDLLGQQLKNHYPNITILNLTEEPLDLSSILNSAQNSDMIIAGIINQDQIKIVKALSKLKKPLIVISFSQPYFIKEFPLISTYLCVYSQQIYSLQAAADVVLGRIKPKGRLPVSIPGIYDLEYKPKVKNKYHWQRCWQSRQGLITFALIIWFLVITAFIKIRLNTKTKHSVLDNILKQRIKLDKLIQRHAHQCTFVSIDVVGSLKLKTNMDKVKISYTFDRYHDYVRKLTRQNNGQIFSTAGDGIMCLFKKPDNAVRAGQKIIKQLPEFNKKENQLNSDFHLRIGINTGKVLFKQKKSETNVFDEVIDIASHIQAIAQPEQIVITEAVYNQLKDKTGFKLFSKSSEINIPIYTWNL